MEWRTQDRWNCGGQGNFRREPESAQPQFLPSLLFLPLPFICYTFDASTSRLAYIAVRRNQIYRIFNTYGDST
ncbi:hypothetical protein BDV93DRAFT_530040 [Ceratobasidium sp. AG-I]|nr:hypothetical protein BDV93DRAFT_530040 [Ceratobasidium sp. AG-I]